jgi:hypothetical protein
MKAAAVVVEAVRPVASAPQARRPAEGVAAASGAKVQPQEAESAASAQQPGEAAAASGAGVVLQPGEAAVSGAGVELLPEVALDAVAEPQQAVAEPDAVAEPQQAVAELDAVAARRPGVEQPAPSARQRAAGHPSAARPSGRPGGLLPCLVPRRAVRSAHAMRRSRAASPSRQSWRAAGCEDLS